MKKRKLLVIGIDGFNLDLFNYLSKKKYIPNLTKILKKTETNILQSSFPPTTGPAWVSFATGKTPGHHGCYNFILIDRDLKEFFPMTGEDIIGKKFYEQLEESGKKVILVNLPGSEPSKINGPVVYSFLAPEGDFFSPANLIDEIPQLKDYSVMPDFFVEAVGGKEEFLRQLKKIEKDRFDIAKKLFERDWDFFFINFFLTDWVQHEKYNAILTGKEKRGSIAIKSYQDIDGYIKWLMKKLPKETNVILLSDHGFRVLDETFYINKWLEKQGYLRVVINKNIKKEDLNNLSFVLKAKNLHWWSSVMKKMFAFSLNFPRFFTLAGQIIRTLDIFFPMSELGVPKPLFSFGLTLDSKKLIAYYVPGQTEGIYINDKKRFKHGVVSEKQYNAVRGRLIENMKRIKNERGEHIFSDVFTKEEVYGDNCLANVPDILFKEKAYIDSALHARQLIEKKNTNWHDQYGIFAILGPHVSKKKIKKDIYLVDLAPTILSYFGIKSKEPFDGKNIHAFE